MSAHASSRRARPSPLTVKHALPMTEIVNYVCVKKTGAKVIFVDACRDNPYDQHTATTKGVGLAGGEGARSGGVSTKSNMAASMKSALNSDEAENTCIIFATANGACSIASDEAKDGAEQQLVCGLSNLDARSCR